MAMAFEFLTFAVVYALYGTMVAVVISLIYANVSTPTTGSLREFPTYVKRQWAQGRLMFRKVAPWCAGIGALIGLGLHTVFLVMY